MPKLLAILFVLVLAIPARGQNYIGLHKDEIRRIVPVELDGFAFDKEVEAKSKSFLKFVNDDEEQTLLFVLNKEGVCTSVSRMYNLWMYERIRKDLKKTYTLDGVNTWTTTKNGEEFEIELKRGEWFVTVITRRR